MEIEKQTLLKLLDRLDELDDDLTIYAEANPEWRAESPAMVAEENEDGGVPHEAQGLTYFLEVFIAKEVNSTTPESYKLMVRACDRTTLLMDAEQDIKELRESVKASERGPKIKRRQVH